VEYFATRPRGSQLAAWISRQSSVVASRDELEAEWQKMEQRFATGEISLPPFWGGYKVVPREMEFWQGRANRLHDRFLYTRRPGNHWQLERLAP
jgi:pyridoxamine 5'-phosphate oxidase